jgi:hypothetical protein
MKLRTPILAAVALITLSVPAVAQETAKSTTDTSVQKWEYLYASARLSVKQKIIGQKSTWVLTVNGQDEPLSAAMNKLGSQGWELAVAYVEDPSILETTYVFKRRISTP